MWMRVELAPIPQAHIHLHGHPGFAHLRAELSPFEEDKMDKIDKEVK